MPDLIFQSGSWKLGSVKFIVNNLLDGGCYYYPGRYNFIYKKHKRQFTDLQWIYNYTSLWIYFIVSKMSRFGNGPCGFVLKTLNNIK